jgi:phosphoribosylamine--glycine ligase
MDNKWFSTGGRVLGITVREDTMTDCRKSAYDIIDKIHFEGMHFRKDIGIKAI